MVWGYPVGSRIEHLFECGDEGEWRGSWGSGGGRGGGEVPPDIGGDGDIRTFGRCGGVGGAVLSVERPAGSGVAAQESGYHRWGRSVGESAGGCVTYDWEWW